MSSFYTKVNRPNGGFVIRNSEVAFSDDVCWNKEFTTYDERSGVITWRLSIYEIVEKHQTGIYLTFVKQNNRCSCDEIKVDCYFDFNLRYGSNNSRQVKVRNIHHKLKPICVYNYGLWEINTAIYKEEKYRFDIRGTINVFNEPDFPIDIETVPTVVLQNLESLFVKQEFCDVAFQTANGCISAHKTILAAQSSVFKRMFVTQMLEKTPGVNINLKDCKKEVLKEMLRFMYGGKVENINTVADELLVLANKYDIQPLMNLCEKALFDRLTISNAISTIKLADVHNAKNLRRLTEEFIVKNKNNLLDTAEFKSLTSTNPEIVIDILRSQLSTS